MIRKHPKRENFELDNYKKFVEELFSIDEMYIEHKT